MATAPEATIADKRERILAFVIDFVVLSLVTGLIWGLFLIVKAAVGVEIFDEPSAQSAIVGLVQWAVIALAVGGYFVVLLDIQGQTLGKTVTGVVAVDTSGDPLTQSQAIKRTIVLLAPLPVMAGASVFIHWFGFPIALAIMSGWLALEALVLLLGDDDQRLGDRVAGTIVVTESR